MPTPNLTDEELDALFRRTTETPPAADATEAWLRIEPRLNSLARYQLAMRRVVRWFLTELSLIALLLLCWFTYSPRLQKTGSGEASLASTDASAVTHSAATLQPHRPQPHAAPEAAQTPLPRIQGQSAKVASEHATSPVAAAVPDASAPLASSRRRGGSVVILPLPDQRKSPSKHDAGDTADQPAVPTSSVVSTVAASTLPQSTGAEATPVSGEASTSTAAASAATTSGTSTASSELVSAESTSATGTMKPAALDTTASASATPPATPPTDTTSTAKKPRIAPTYRFGVALQYAPEVSSVRMADIEKTGHDVGVQVEYFFTPRLSLNTGVLHAVKRYEARGSDYHVQYRRPIERVYAVCGMLDIPLNLRYALLYRPSYQVFASAGISSLLMRDEQYELLYTSYDQPVTYTKQVINGSNHPFSVLNLSAGYERQVQARWGVRAEPFVKIPLGGVGYGKVKLSSAGVFFSVQYRLLQPALKMH